MIALLSTPGIKSYIVAATTKVDTTTGTTSVAIKQTIK